MSYYSNLYMNITEYTFTATYKRKEYRIALLLDYMLCTGIIRKENDRLEYQYSVQIYYDNLDEISISEYKKEPSILIKGLDTDRNEKVEIYFPTLTCIEEIKTSIEKCKQKKITIIEQEEKREKEAEEKAKKIQAEIQEKRERHEKAVAELKSKVDSIKEKYLYYTLDQKDYYETFMYVDEEKNLVIMSYDTKSAENVISKINYENIHYYEKAGAIYYVSNVEVEKGISSNVAGSFDSNKLKLTPVVVGYLLGGVAGMGIGALISYNKREELKEQIGANSLKITSTAQRIDERSIILNIFSEQKKQYIDIEFPQDSYNFFQTKLTEKKYDIVLAVEKKTALEEQNYAQPKSIEVQNNIGLPLQVEDFESRCKKLKIMFDNGLISEEEYNNNKKVLLNSFMN